MAVAGNLEEVYNDEDSSLGTLQRQWTTIAPRISARLGGRISSGLAIRLGPQPRTTSTDDD
jgi:uncharacterized membrane protein